MEQLETLVNSLYLDPESIAGVPDNRTIIDTLGDAFLKQIKRDLTAQERVGFLEIWRASQTTELIAGLSDDALAETETAARDELYSGQAPESRTLDLRFIFTKIGAERSARQFKQV